MEQPNEHKLQTLSHVAAAVKSEFADLTKKLEAELEKYAVKEKEGWVKLDKLEEECKNLTKQVEKSTENLVRQLIDFATLGHHHWQSILLVRACNKYPAHSIAVLFKGQRSPNRVITCLHHFEQ